MTLWNMKFEYDSSGKGADLDQQLADTPEEAISQTFSSKWNLTKTTHDDNKPRYYYRTKDAHVTVMVYEQEGVCPNCGSENPFLPTIKDCPACRKTSGEVTKDAEFSIGGWNRL